MCNHYFVDILRDMKSLNRTLICLIVISSENLSVNIYVVDIVTGMFTCWFRQQTAKNSDHHSPDTHIGFKV